MANTGAPWSLPTPDLPDQPHAPLQLGDLADSVHAALGRAYPCTSGARPAATAGMLIYETDTDTLLISPDGSAWRTLFSTPTVTGTGGTAEATNVLTAATNFTVSGQRFYKSGGMVAFTVTITRQTSTLASTTDGNITNTAMATVAAGWRPPLGNWQIGSGGSGGKMYVGYVAENGTMAVGALLPGTAGDWAVGGAQVWGGVYPCGDG